MGLNIPARQFLHSVVFLTLLLTACRTGAQHPGLVVFGTVRDFITRDSIPYPTVTIQEIDAALPPIKVVTNASGRYEFTLSERRNYIVHYSANGKVGKSVRLELSGPTDEEWNIGYGMSVDIVLLDSLPDIDYTFFHEPFGIARYDSATAIYTWDLQYTQGMADRQKALLEIHKNRINKDGWAR